jgi:predicted PurR-regulated permease PerM
VATSTERERIGAIGFYGVVVLLGVLVYQLFRPFLVPLTWAAVLAICFYPTHYRFEQRLSRNRAALLSTASVGLLVVIPLLGVALAFALQASRILNNVPHLLTETPGFARRWLETGLTYVPGGDTIDPEEVLIDGARRVAAFLSGQAAGVLQHLAVFIVDFVIAMFALFFLFRDAALLMAALRRIVPLSPEVRERLIAQTRTLVTASVTSGLIVAAVQGVLGGLVFWALGLPAPLFWGVVMGLFCLLPFGAWVVWAPAAIGLVASGSVGRGLLLAALGAGVVSAVDNLLRPILLSGRSEMNGLLLFISLLGGVIAFGTVGLVFGPVLMATSVGLFETFTTDRASADTP